MHRILVVDDEPHIVDLLREFLGKNDFTVQVAYSGKEALEIINGGETIDLVILDKKMPRVDGIAVLKEIREKRSDLPVILLTGSTGMCLADDAKFLGCDYFMKPVHLNELLDKITEKLSQKERQG